MFRPSCSDLGSLARTSFREELCIIIHFVVHILWFRKFRSVNWPVVLLAAPQCPLFYQYWKYLPIVLYWLICPKCPPSWNKKKFDPYVIPTSQSWKPNLVLWYSTSLTTSKLWRITRMPTRPTSWLDQAGSFSTFVCLLLRKILPWMSIHICWLDLWSQQAMLWSQIQLTYIVLKGAYHLSL